MKKILLTLILLAGLAGSVNAQQLGRIFTSVGAPTGGCNIAWFNVDRTDGVLYYCVGGVWTAAAVVGGSVAWADITGTPTTLAGYGITDALPLAGGTMTGAITVVAPDTGQESLILPFGTNPTSPTAGSIWCRTADNFCYIRANGVSQAIAWQGQLSTMPGVGIVAQTDSASPPTLAARTITGTANRIVVTNGAGTAGNPTIDYTIVDPITWTFDGGGAQVAASSVGYKRVVAACTIVGWSIEAKGSSPTTTIDVWRVATGTSLPAVGNTIMGTKPALASGNAIKSTTLTGWSPTALAADDILAANIDASNAANIWTSFTLYCQR